MKRMGFIDGRRLAGWTFPTSAVPGNGQVINITDPSYGATPGYMEMIKYQFRPTGVRTGTTYVTGLQLELYPQGTCTYLQAFGIYVATPVGAPVLTTLWGIDIFMEALGSAVITHLTGISVNMNYTNPVSGVASHLRLYTGGSTAMPSAISLEGVQALALFRLTNASPPYIAGAVGGVQNGRVRVNIGGVDYYIPLNTA